MSELVDLSVESGGWEVIALAVALLVLGAALLILEFFVVSMGILLATSIACVVAAVYFAFSAGSTVGWMFVVTVPVLAVVIVRWGVQQVQNSRLVPQDEVTEEAGYHHVADRLGVTPGSIGMMSTLARPSGRARFEGGECDVQSQGRPLEKGARVVVKRIDGPIIFVAPVEGEPEDR